MRRRASGYGARLRRARKRIRAREELRAALVTFERLGAQPWADQADGKTTREAASAVFVSPKTVEYHLRHVYAKLGIHSRDELAAALTRPDVGSSDGVG